jgi:hypothetical protein
MFLVSGVVRGEGPFYLSDVDVSVMLPDATVIRTTTDDSGTYRLSSRGDVVVRAEKAGYAREEQSATVDRDIAVSFELDRLQDSGSIAGSYTLVFTASLAGFTGTREGNTVHFDITDSFAFDAPVCIERLDPGRNLAFAGVATGAIAALLVPTPRPDIIVRLLEVLARHDALEEGPEGVYAACDDLVAGEVDAILEELRQYPPVRVAPHHDSPLVERHIEETLALARQA